MMHKTTNKNGTVFNSVTEKTFHQLLSFLAIRSIFNGQDHAAACSSSSPCGLCRPNRLPPAVGSPHRPPLHLPVIVLVAAPAIPLSPAPPRNNSDDPLHPFTPKID